MSSLDPDDPAVFNLNLSLHLSVQHREAKALLGLTDEPVAQTQRAAPIAAPVQGAGKRPDKHNPK